MRYLRAHFSFLKYIPTAPFILSLIILLVITDLWMEVYHRVCFPFYGIPYVQRRKYIKIMDRSRLSYGNGAVRYWARIASETERYWCGVQHQKTPYFITPDYQKDFANYGDKEDFKKKYGV